MIRDIIHRIKDRFPLHVLVWPVRVQGETAGAEVTAAVDVPTIGIGAGPQCDGQVLVLHDFLGLDSGHRRPKFVKDFLAEGGSVAGATRAYADAVRDGSFPDEQHAYAQ